MPLKILRTVLIFFSLFILCQCAAKHQPKFYAAYFPEGQSTKKEREQYKERAILEESLPTLSLFQKKRLYDLYEFELSRVSTNNLIRKELEEKKTKIQPEIGPLLEVETRASSVIEKSEKNTTVYPWNGRLRKIKELWNKDENEKAMAIVDEILSRPDFNQKADADEKFRLYLLKFRILQDDLSSPHLLVAYERLKELSPCRPETTQAGFILALRAFLAGKKEEALTLFENQCDEDKSVFNQLKRFYWIARFQPDPVKSKEAYASLMKLPVFGYYQYLAKVSMGEDYVISLPDPTINLDSFTVSQKVSGYLLEAEKRLEGNLKRDSDPFLIKAAESLKSDPDDNADALIYITRLFQASGNHLEAARLYGKLQISFQKRSSFEKLNALWASMYPRPYSNTVEWVASQWGVERNFIWSIMRQESAFNAFATSTADARGLMQMMPFLAGALNKEWKYNSTYRDRGMYSTDENIKLGAFHLHQLFKYLEHPALVAASYNAGIQRVSRWTKRMGNIPMDVFVELIPINETRNYVKLVLRNYIHYHAIENDGLVEKGFISALLPASVLP